MQQIAIYRSGERDYANIKGQTGPLVYPAGHVMIYNALYRLTNDGTDIFRAQCVFTVLYLASLSVVMACYRQAKVCFFFPLREAWLMKKVRHPLICSPSSYSLNGYIPFSFFDCSTIAWLYSAFSQPSTVSRQDGSPSAASYSPLPPASR